MQKLIREMSVADFLGMCRLRLAKGKTKFTVFVPASLVPPRPLKLYKTVEIRDEVVGVSLMCFTKPKEDGWLIHVRIQEQSPFNPVIPGDLAGLLKK